MAAYKYYLHEDYSTCINIKGVQFKNSWIKIKKDGGILIKQRYAWNGCSPKIRILDLLFGTPDGALNLKTGYEYCYHASLVHDVLYQFKKELPISRKQADLVFRDRLKSTGFFWWRVYYLVVRAAGWIFGKWNK